MATTKFKETSPYISSKPKTRATDFVYNRYLEDIAMMIEFKDDPTVKLALFGLGRAGSVHFTSIFSDPRVKILYIVDNVETNWQIIEKFLKEKVIFLNYKESDRVFEDPNVDVILVATPTLTHTEIITKALKANKAVFCESPIAKDHTMTAACYDMARRIDKPLFCAFNRRFDASYLDVRERVRNGDVGHVHMIKTVSHDCPLSSIDYLKMSGGVFQDFMIHDIDLITWILGEYPDKVTVLADANIPEIKEINDFDTIAATLHFPSGTLGIIDLSRNSNIGSDQRLEVFGPKGIVRVDNERPIPSIKWQCGLNGPTTIPIWYSSSSRYMNSYRREFYHFVNVALGKVECTVSSKETLAVSKIAMACEESARNGRVVELSWEDGELPRLPWSALF